VSTVFESCDQAPVAMTPSRRPVYQPSREQIALSQLSAFIRHCEGEVGRTFEDYRAFERFAIDHSADFWALFLRWSGLRFEGSASPAIVGDRCESATFFPDVTLNYVDNLLRLDGEFLAPHRPALSAIHADRPAERWSRGELHARVRALSAGLQELGLDTSSRVAIVANNTPGAIVGCLGAAAIGCTVSTGALDVGTPALVSRFGQVEPSLLLADLPDPTAPLGAQQRERFAELVRALPSLHAIVLLDDHEAPEGITVEMHRASALIERHAQSNPEWPALPFNHPLFILFTSGTTGQPKCLVHGAGGTLVEHFKEHRLHCDLRATDKLFFQTSTGWMMWNWQLSALATGSEIVIYDGPVTGAETLWRIVSRESVTMFGTSPAYLQLCESGGWPPGGVLDFSRLRAVLSTGSILYPRHQDWLWRSVKPLPIQSISGGTDIVGCFILGNPNLPVFPGECQSRSLGLDVRSLGAEAQGGVGELVCANPFPSRPLGLLNDPDGSRFHKAYFAEHEGMWTHGDLIEFTPDGSARMHGRSDGVLNIRGIRIGPAEIYRVLDDIPEISEAMAVEQEVADEPGGARLILLVVLKQGHVLDNTLVGRIKRELGSHGSPAHVPAAVLAVEQLPTTFSGKRSERSARDALSGRPVVNEGALRNPESLAPLKAFFEKGEPPTSVAQAAAGDASKGEATLVQSIRQAWEEILEITPIGLEDNYFEIGGDSLKGMRLVAAIRRRTGREIPVSMLFGSPTIAGLAAQIEQQATAPYQPLVELATGRRSPPLFVVHGVGGSVMELRTLVQSLQSDRVVYGLQAKGFRESEVPHDRIEAMAREYVAAIRSVQPAGPYLILGYSFGGWVAYEMARMLRADGEKIAFLGMLDATTRERFWTVRIWAEYLARRLRIGLAGERHRSLVHWLALAKALAARVRRAFVGGPPPQDAELGTLSPEFQRVRDAGLAAAAAHVPQPSDLSVVLFRSDLNMSHLCDPKLVWEGLVPQVEVHDVAGDHRSMVRTPFVEALARRVSQSLQAHAPLMDGQGRLYDPPQAEPRESEAVLDSAVLSVG
jgi:acetoacetyl-CoA synthetase